MSCSKSYYNGPNSDHFKDGLFSSRDPIPVKTFFSVWKWRLTADRKKWPSWVEITPDKPPAQVTGRELRVSFVNHSTALLQTHGLNILTDPVWSQRCSPISFMGPKRVHAPGIAWDDLPKIDIVAISHSHYDHLDIPTLKKLVARDNPQIFVPLGVDTIIRGHIPKARLVVMDWNDTQSFNADLKIHAVPAQHWSARSLSDRNKALWTGFVFDLPDGKIYYSGDTGFGSGRIFKDIHKKFGDMRFVILPIGAYEPRWFMKDAHINPDEAVAIYQMVGAQNGLAVHFGTFQLSDEAIDAPPKDLQVAIAKNKIAPDTFRTLKPGQAWVLP